jgi:hypothetical protein
MSTPVDYAQSTRGGVLPGKAPPRSLRPHHSAVHDAASFAVLQLLVHAGLLWPVQYVVQTALLLVRQCALQSGLLFESQ